MLDSRDPSTPLRMTDDGRARPPGAPGSVGSPSASSAKSAVPILHVTRENGEFVVRVEGDYPWRGSIFEAETAQAVLEYARQVWVPAVIHWRIGEERNGDTANGRIGEVRGAPCGRALPHIPAL